MTFRPVNPYDTLVQQLLQNVTRTTEATERGLQAQREERLIDEQRAVEQQRIDQQRAWQVADTQQAHRFALEQQANQILAGAASRLGGLMAFADTEELPTYRALFDAISQDSGLTGQEALNRAIAGQFTFDVNGERTTMNVWEEAERLDTARRVVIAQEGFAQAMLESAMTDALNFDLPMNVRLERANLFYESPYVPADMRESFLRQVVPNEEARQRIRTGDKIQEADLQGRLLGIAMSSIDLAMKRELGERYPAMLDADYDTAMANLQGIRQTFDATELEQFLTVGILPESEERQERLARTLNFVDSDGNGSIPMLQAAARRHWTRWQRRQNIAMQSEQNQMLLYGAQFDMTQVQANIGRHDLEQAITWDTLNNRVKLAEIVATAQLSGEVEKLESLQALAEMPQFAEQLGHIEWDTVLSYAREIRGDEDSIREHNAFLRQNEADRLRREEWDNIEGFISSTGGTFVLEDFSINPETGNRDALEAAIRDYVGTIPPNTLRAYGLTEEQLVDRLMGQALKSRVLLDRTEAQAAFDALVEAGVPTDTQARRAWQSAAADALGRTGVFSDKEIDAIVNGTLDTAALSRAKTEADMRHTQQLADQAWSQTMVNMASLLPTEGGMSMEQYETMLGLFEAEQDDLITLMNGQACGLTTDASDFGMWGSTFNEDNEQCLAWRDRYEELRQRRAYMVDAVIFGEANEDGQVESVGFAYAPGEEPGDGSTAPSSRELIAAINSYAPGEGASFNVRGYLSLPPAAQALIAQGVRENAPVGGPDGLNATIQFALASLAGAPQFVSVPAGLPSVNELNVNSPEWREKPVEERASELEGTEEWMKVVSDIVNGQVVPTEQDYMNYATRFGFVNPRSNLGGTFRGIGNTMLGVGADIIQGLGGDVQGPAPLSDFVPDVNAVKAALRQTRDRLAARLEHAQQANARTQAGGGFTVPGQGTPEGPMSPPPQPFPQPAPGEQPAEASQGTDASLLAALQGMLNVRPATPYGSGIPAEGINPTAPAPSAPAGPPAQIADLRTSENAYQAIRNEEGFRATAYPDAGGWAVGYGQRGSGITEGTTVTREEAEEMLRNHVAGVERDIRRYLDPNVVLTQQQWDALVSLVYNIGGGAFRRSQVAKLINAGDFAGAADAFLAHNTVNGVPNEGLTARRQREREMFLAGTNTARGF